MYICFDVGGTAIKAGIIDSEGRILAEVIERTRVDGGVEGVLQQFKNIYDSLIGELGIEKEKIRGVGFGIPGYIDPQTGIVLNAPNLGWKNINIIRVLKDHFTGRIFVINDANAAALGEMWQGAGKGCRNLLCLTIGTGIGAGIIINNNVYYGTKGMAGEIGHFQVRPHKGRECNCGKIGCLETESSGAALVFYAEEAVEAGKKTVLSEIKKKKGKISARDVTCSALRGDRESNKILNKATYYLGYTLANIYMTLAPERIIVGGGISRAGRVLFNPLIRWFDKLSYPLCKGDNIILPAKLGNRAGMIGVAKYIAQKTRE